jgi:hypothetical protein
MANHPEGDQPEYLSDEVIPVEETDLDDDGDDGDFEDPDDSETGHESDPDDEGKDHVETRASQVRRAFARRVITKYAELADPGVKPEHLELAASLMPGVRNDPAELAIAILCGVRPRTQAVSDVMGVREADAMDAGVIVASWPNARLSQAWNLVHMLDLVPAKRPAGIKGSLALARAVHKMPKDKIDVLDQALALLRRKS